MANFDKALKLTLQHEGGYSNVSNDTGGMTYCGISRKNNPDWKGWAIVDAHLPLKWNEKINNPDLNDKVSALYRLNYWNKIWGENIQNQEVANFLFDWFVNSGYHAIVAIQKIVDAKPDGVMGTGTIRAINNHPARELLSALIKSRTEFVKGIVRNRPTQEKFLAGWLDRIGSFKTA